MKLTIPVAAGLCGFLLCSKLFTTPAHAVTGWLNWRGPQQNGTSLETGLPDSVDPEHPLWMANIPGQSTSVLADGRLYIMGYVGEGADLQEGVFCFDAETGKELWRQLFSDFLSDTIYLRYGTSSPTVDEETGDVFMQGTQGILAAFTPDGQLLWKHSLMEEYGRLTFPNSRTASPVVDKDLVITRGITANWGAQGPGADRFYAFDKKSGALVWSSTPGERPMDNSFSHSQLAWLDGRRVLYSATGDGAVVCVNARTGEPIWRVHLTKAGINSTLLVHKDDKIISIYGTPYEPGQLVALKIPHLTPMPKPHESNVHIALGKVLPDGARIISEAAQVPQQVLEDDSLGQEIKKCTLPDGRFKEGSLIVVTKLSSGTALKGPPVVIGDTNLISPGWRFADGTVAYATNQSTGPMVFVRSSVAQWADDISTSTSSPILVGDRIYVVSEKGYLYAVDANDGKILWNLQLGIEERNSSPIYADGKLYVPMLDDPALKKEGSAETGTKGALYIIQPTDTEGKILCHVAVEGRCFGTPTAYNGKLYLQTTRHVYCFGKPGNNSGLPAPPTPEAWPAPGPAKQLQVVPAEVLMRPGQTEPFHVRELDANGFTTEELSDLSTVKWDHFIPPTAKVKSTMNGTFNSEGKLTAAEAATPSAGAFEASVGDLKGYFRGRILPYLPIKQDFEWAKLTEKDPADTNVPFAYPPLPWIGARLKFEIRDLDGNKVLAKTLDNPFLQRATVFIGDPSTKDYTIEADVMSEGNKRVMSVVGLVCQRYYIVLKGAFKQLEVNSTPELFTHNVPFVALPNVWYHLKARVDVAADGSGVIRAKAWKKGDPEPDQWTIEVPHKHAHESGSPGLFTLAPQKRVYFDNITVTSNEK
jgi:outer membrane protein assembly factor BamB